MGGVTLDDVAALAGVSQPTASRVLNGSARTPSPAVVEAVRRAADELGYVSNAQAQALVRSHSGLVGLVVHDLADPYFSTIASGAQREAAQRGRQMLVATTLRSPRPGALRGHVVHRLPDRCHRARRLEVARLATDEGRQAVDAVVDPLSRATADGSR